MKVCKQMATPQEGSDQQGSGEDKRPVFGNRLLTDEKNVFAHNAWDNVVWDEEQEEEAKRKTLEQLASPVEKDRKDELEEKADQYWDKFYQQHRDTFFKDRHWLFTEFPELAPRDELASEDKLAPKDEPASTNELSRKDVSEVNDSKAAADCTQLPVGDSVVQSNTAGQTVNKGGNSDGTTMDNAVELPQISSPSEERKEDCPETFPGEHSRQRVWEVGCGVGNTVFPVLQTNNDPGLMMYCCDFSPTAVQLVKEHPDYDSRRCTAFVCDITDSSAAVPFPEQSMDVIILLFVLSAINPDKMQYVLTRLASYLKPGGTLLFRDYGRYDLAQLRFGKGRCLSENFYVRGDGTRVYFFTQEELRQMLLTAGLVESQNYIDRRLQVNRGRQLKMYRVWIQCKYTKPLPGDS